MRMLTKPRDWREIPLWADATEEQWNDWRWQVSHRITNLEQLKQVVNLTEEEEAAIRDSQHLFRLGITPHYATLIDPDDPHCPMRLQAVPKYAELAWADYEMGDPLHEDVDSPVPGITHRYPDRVLFLITHECSLYCRHCTRRRIVGDQEAMSTAMLDQAIAYIRAHPEIRDVLISGGDPLAVPDRRLEYVIKKLRAIPHVEIIRIGTRMPVVLPQRITPELVNMLRQYHPIWLNTHFNHPFEVQHPKAREAMERLADAGIPTGNQSVLLKGVNDCAVVMRRLVHELVKVRCRPYYIYNCDLSEGLSHFRTSVAKGVAIIEALRGHTSGFCVPTFVVDAPGGGGKIPVMPQYLISQSDGRVILRNFEGKISIYHEGTPEDHVADGKCTLCGTDHSEIKIGPAAELWAVRRRAGEVELPEGVTRLGEQKPLITPDQLAALEPAGSGSGDD
ncbi:lysine 2,3-aminomutase [Symbiobacterium thermophilum IAM 14863]|uniref:L-lysine 2,3-aminomutase n=2 Tax=Symbiobacterium thermophilum TaxID=2734 RepID=Q67TH3_SYMTH|nr:lysine 2,3-aminomutase [Symbiobacterium thermophilum IAM 14863]